MWFGRMAADDDDWPAATAAAACDADDAWPPFALLLPAIVLAVRCCDMAADVRCVDVVIFVSVYGGKLSSIRESIMRAMCWKPDVVGCGL